MLSVCLCSRYPWLRSSQLAGPRRKRVSGRENSDQHLESHVSLFEQITIVWGGDFGLAGPYLAGPSSLWGQDRTAEPSQMGGRCRGARRRQAKSRGSRELAPTHRAVHPQVMLGHSCQAKDARGLSAGRDTQCLSLGHFNLSTSDMYARYFLLSGTVLCTVGVQQCLWPQLLETSSISPFFIVTIQNVCGPCLTSLGTKSPLVLIPEADLR